MVTYNLTNYRMLHIAKDLPFSKSMLRRKYRVLFYVVPSIGHVSLIQPGGMHSLQRRTCLIRDGRSTVWRPTEAQLLLDVVGGF